MAAPRSTYNRIYKVPFSDAVAARLPTESPVQYKWFCLYRDLEPEDRTAARVIELTGKAYNSVMSMMTHFQWKRRAAEWDTERDLAKRRAIIQAEADMATRHIQITMMMQEKVRQRIEMLDPAKLSPNQVAIWVEVATRVERLAREMPTEISRKDAQSYEHIVLDSTDAANHAAAVFEHLAIGPGRTGRSGTDGDAGSLATGPASGHPQPRIIEVSYQAVETPDRGDAAETREESVDIPDFPRVVSRSEAG